VYIFDQDRVLRYIGRIDDSEVKTVTSHDARKCLEAPAGRKESARETRKFWLLDQNGPQDRYAASRSPNGTPSP